jgi:hypothetical protein
MADNSVPVWFSGLTFAAGILSGQIADYFKSKREREARRAERKAVRLERRAQFQNETLIALQEAAASAIDRFLFVLNHRSLIDADSELLERVSTSSDELRNLIWRSRLLTSRVSDSEVRDKGLAFNKILGDTDVFLGKIDPSDAIADLFQCFNQLNSAVSLSLRKLAELEDAGDV